MVLSGAVDESGTSSLYRLSSPEKALQVLNFGCQVCSWDRERIGPLYHSVQQNIPKRSAGR